MILDFSVQHITDGNGVAIALTGMTIVFIGLVVISCFIAMLPKILGLLDRNTAKEIEAPPGIPAVEEKSGMDEEVAAAISAVVHMELERTSVADTQRITILREQDRRSMWSTVGKMKTFSRRSKDA